MSDAPGPAGGAKPRRSERLLRDEHIRRRPDFQQAYTSGRRLGGRFMTVFVMANRLEVGRLGIAATRKLGDAVRRNRAKRLVRELYRRNKIAPGLDLVVIPRREMFDADYGRLEADFRSLLRRASGR